MRANAKPGISVANASAYSITNALVVENGGSSSSFGGIALSASTGAVSFATVLNNVGMSGNINGIQCASSSAIDSSIVWGNTNANGTQASSSCAFTYSDVGDGVTGNGNIASNPNLNSSTYEPNPSAPVIDAANPNSHNPHDLAGIARPQGAGPDMGAYEYKP